MNNFIKEIPFPKVILPIVFINLLTIVFYFAVRTYLPPEVPLLYGLPHGEDQLVNRDILLFPVGLNLILLVVNTILTKITKDNFSQQALIYIVVATTLLGIITIAKIVFLVGGF